MRDLTDRVKEFQDEDSTYGAERIARTETSAAYNTGKYEGGAQNPDIVGGEWIGVLDNRIRESHAEMHGTRALIGEPFGNGLLYPGDPNGPPEEVINCRCTYNPLDAEEMGMAA